MYEDSIAISEKELRTLLEETKPGAPLLPELDQAMTNTAALRQAPQTQLILQASTGFVADIEAIPQITYSLYREYQRSGYWQNYGRIYFAKRAKLTAAALRLLLGDLEWLDVVQDYIWSLCEETNWAISYHEWIEVDLFSAETSAMLAQLITALEDKLADEVCQRVRNEIQRRVFVPYLERHKDFGWYKGGSNWNGVCNGSVGSAFLLLEQDLDRLAKALALVLDGLDTFVHTAFEDDGASTEGPSYWQYGLIHFVEFSEMLRQRTQGRIDLLSSERMRAIATYPLHMMLSAERFANFADCPDSVLFHPGFINRLAERTGVPDLFCVLAERIQQDTEPSTGVVPAGLMRWNADIALRTLLWWDGRRPTPPALVDAYLPKLGAVRLVSRTPAGPQLVMAIKAGHNAENHNHNDVGSFIVQVGDQTFLCDPGPGLYDSTYFTKHRYENIFASSFGHSVPRISGHPQSAGREFQGRITAYEPDADPKRVTAEIGEAYDVAGLESIRRTISLGSGQEAGTVRLQDSFVFTDEGAEAEEAFVTWLEAEVSGPVAILHGEKHDLQLTIEEPPGVVFTLATFEEECRANEREGILKRLSFTLEPEKGMQTDVRVRASVT